MSQSLNPRKLDDLLAGAVDLTARPDFAAWRQKHPEAVEGLQSLPVILSKQRSKMIRIARYSTSVALLLIVAIGTSWMFFSPGTTSAWAQVIDQLSKVHSATCNLHVHNGDFDQVSKTYLEGSRVRVENSNEVTVMDFLQDKMLVAQRWSKKAMIHDMKKDSGGMVALGSNPLNDLIEMKNAPAERLPDEQIDDMVCQVYRVKDTAFMGYKVPWVKLWLDPHTKLPVQIHSVVGNFVAMTFNDFRWNAPFDPSLLELVVPKGYLLVEVPGREKASKTVALPRTGDASSIEAGREIPMDDIAKTLDMLGQRIEANYKAMHSWRGTFDVKERYRFTSPHPQQYEEISHAAVTFYSEPGRDRIRIDYRAVEPIRIIGDDNIKPTVELPESRWVRTPDQLLRFPVSELQHGVEGFPQIDGFNAGQPFRVLYREPPKAAERYIHQGYIDPRSFFGDGQPYWKQCSLLASALRGERGPDEMECLKRNMAIRERRNGAGMDYVLMQRFKSVESNSTLKMVFSSAAGFNVVSVECSVQGQPWQTLQQYTFRKENGVFIPSEVEFNSYDDRSTKESWRLRTQHRVFTLKKTQVNEPIDPAVFEIPSLGLRRGDRMADWIENRMGVFDGKQLVPADKFKRQPAVKAKRDDAERGASTNNMKQIGLAMHNYAQANGAFPPAYKAGKDGKPLLSWRVLILPYLEQNELFKQFHLDEPWDSPHNKQLIARMPSVYESPNSTPSSQWKTNYLTVRGKDTVFPGKKGISFAEIRDGTSSTIMTVEVSDAKAVLWTKPDDFDYDKQNPMKGLVGVWPDGFLAGFADGSVRFIWSPIDPTILKAFFTRNGGETIGPDALGR